MQIRNETKEIRWIWETEAFGNEQAVPFSVEQFNSVTLHRITALPVYSCYPPLIRKPVTDIQPMDQRKPVKCYVAVVVGLLMPVQCCWRQSHSGRHLTSARAVKSAKRVAVQWQNRGLCLYIRYRFNFCGFIFTFHYARTFVNMPNRLITHLLTYLLAMWTVRWA